jgi:hypothetical protein
MPRIWSSAWRNDTEVFDGGLQTYEKGSTTEAAASAHQGLVVRRRGPNGAQSVKGIVTRNGTKSGWGRRGTE